MKYIRILLSVVILCQVGVSSAKSDFDLIIENIRDVALYVPDNDAIEGYLNLMKDDGSFTDIDYTITSKSGWTPHNHYFRLMDMVTTYVNPSCRYYSNHDLYQKIIKGLRYWTTNTPYATNWWHTQIEEPQYFGLMLILMRFGVEKLPLSLETTIIDRWKNNGSNPAKRSGANRSDIALHWMFFACLTYNQDLLLMAMNYLFEPIAFTNGEGIQVDNSFFQHGQQLYICGYGETLLESVLYAAVCIAGTKYRLADEKLEILRGYVLNSWAHCIRGDVVNWNCLGRQLARVDYLKDSFRRTAIVDKMIIVDKDHESEYIAIRDRLSGMVPPSEGINPYHVHFFRGDYSLHIREPFNFSTRMVSSRTCRQEFGNGENLQNYYLSDGSTVISRTGHEYLNLMPLWDWNKIPGVTAPLLDTIPRTPELWSVYGTSEFAGGVSDSIYGCSTYKYFDEYSGVNTGASKGWFYFDDEVVCLGAGVTSTHENVRTTINQCWGGQMFSVETADGIKSYEENVGETKFGGNLLWVLHDSIGYYFPDKQNVLIENQEKTGNWRWISTVQEDKELHGKVFTLSLAHTSQSGTYSYIVIPSKDEQSMHSYAVNSQVEIMANTDSVQVVRNSSKNLYECIFYKPCTFKCGDISIFSMQPCCLIVKAGVDNITVHIADPSQQNSGMTVGVKSIDMENMQYGTCDFSGLNEQYAGMTKVMTIGKRVTAIHDIIRNPIVAYSENPYTYRFDKRYQGKYTLSRLNGVVEKEHSFDADQISIEARKGMYILTLHLDGQNSFAKKLIIK